MKASMHGSNIPENIPGVASTEPAEEGARDNHATPVKGKRARSENPPPSSHEKRMKPLLEGQDKLLGMMQEEGEKDRQVLAQLFGGNGQKLQLAERKLNAHEEELKLKKKQLELDVKKFEADRVARDAQQSLMMAMLQKLNN